MFPSTYNELSRMIRWLSGISALAVCACAPVQPPTPQEGVTDVSVVNLAFDPQEVTITQGEKVRWTNREPGVVRHTTTSGTPGAADAGSLWDENLETGEAFTQQFDDVGEFDYFCRFHASMPAMRAKVIVVAPQPP